jgi:hypothetical protein
LYPSQKADHHSKKKKKKTFSPKMHLRILESSIGVTLSNLIAGCRSSAVCFHLKLIPRMVFNKKSRRKMDF